MEIICWDADVALAVRYICGNIRIYYGMVYNIYFVNTQGILEEVLRGYSFSLLKI